MNDLIENIIARTGLPAEAVQPVIGAVLAHLGDVLPAPIAHQVAIFLGVHQEESGDTNTAATDAGGAEPGLGGLLGGLMGGGGAGGLLGGLLGGAGGTGAQGGFAGAGSLMNAAESLLAGVLAGKR